ncbi:MAG TPA: NADPH:quinone reductase [Phycisphaerae bacterium]|nr:NADPH:quinone reductase [Phycisphaerae bacterium]HRY69854.1 NADPH:quinone reductase [Phycisphaerae bacterium]HSA25419.1 NADPH:quinone reductase [Phycisphaerae bacterium]
MKAIRVHAFGEPEVMKIETVADPKPAEGEVVVAVRAVGVNPVDTYIRSGQYPVLPKLPYTPGIDAAGIIETVGRGVTRLGVGTRVYVAGARSGTYAEKALCRESQVHPLPDRLSFAQGAGVYVPYATAYRALFQRAQGRPGEWLLVHGATGGVGLAALQFASNAGFRIIATAGTEQGRKLTIENGAQFVLNHHAPDHFEQALTLTSGHGVDVILEMLANVNLDRDLPLLAKNGRVVVIGSRGRIEIDPRATMGRDSAILGMALLNTPEADQITLHAAIGAGLANGALTPVVSHQIPLPEAPQAHHQIVESRAHGKIVLRT